MSLSRVTALLSLDESIHHGSAARQSPLHPYPLMISSLNPWEWSRWRMFGESHDLGGVWLQQLIGESKIVSALEQRLIRYTKHSFCRCYTDTHPGFWATANVIIPVLLSVVMWPKLQVMKLLAGQRWGSGSLHIWPKLLAGQGWGSGSLHIWLKLLAGQGWGSGSLHIWLKLK